MTSVITQKSGESSDKRMVTYIHETLRNLHLDKVETAQYTVEVPSLDADNPSEITLSKSEEEVLVLKYGGKNSTEPLKKEGGPIVAIPGRARVRILYTVKTLFLETCFQNSSGLMLYIGKSVTIPKVLKHDFIRESGLHICIYINQKCLSLALQYNSMYCVCPWHFNTTVCIVF